VAFHPDFKNNVRFYTVHTETGNALTAKQPDLTPQPNTLYHGVVTEWRANDPTAASFHGQRREVPRLGFAGQIHGIQHVDFNPTAQRGTWSTPATAFLRGMQYPVRAASSRCRSADW
jgi:hypothetical protein